MSQPFLQLFVISILSQTFSFFCNSSFHHFLSFSVILHSSVSHSVSLSLPYQLFFQFLCCSPVSQSIMSSFNSLLLHHATPQSAESHSSANNTLQNCTPSLAAMTSSCLELTQPNKHKGNTHHYHHHHLAHDQRKTLDCTSMKNTQRYIIFRHCC